jgi:DNA-binding IclR family transcriptional regulator
MAPQMQLRLRDGRRDPKIEKPGRSRGGSPDSGRPLEDRRGKAAPRVQSVARAMAILVAVANSPQGLRAMEIAQTLGLGRQATYHLLHTLIGSGMLTRNPQGLHVLGLQMATLADAFVRQLAIPEHLAPLVRRIAQETGETAYAVGWRDGEIVNLVAAPGSNAVHAMTVPQGYHRHAHARATGKLLLSHASPDLLERYLSTHRLERRTKRTLTSRKSLEQELDRVREKGYAIDREEFATGLCCLALPIGNGSALFAVGISAPAERFDSNFDLYLKTMRRAVRAG